MTIYSSLSNRAKTRFNTLRAAGVNYRMALALADSITQNDVYDRRDRSPKVMSSPPTVTLGGANAGSTISGAVPVAATDPVFTFYGGNPVPVAWGYLSNTNTGSTFDADVPFFVEFMFDGSKFDFVAVGERGNGSYRIFVDGELTAAAPLVGPTATGSDHSVLVDFTTRKVRRITLHMGCGFYGLRLAPTDTVWKSNRPMNGKTYWLGDSFTIGANATYPTRTYLYKASEVLGWDNPIMGGEAGTGYLTNGGGGGGRSTFRSRVQYIVPHAPDNVVIYGGTNDSGQSAAAVQAEATLLYADLARQLPAAKVYVIGPQYPSSTADAARDAVATGLTAACAASPNVMGYISPKSWITGTGRVGATTGTGNADFYTSADGLHPTDAGHDYLGDRIARAIAAL